MKKIWIALLVVALALISSNSFAARWDGATVDMSGSNESGSSNICDQPRPIFDIGRAKFWDSMCGGNTPAPEPDPYIPEVITPEPDPYIPQVITPQPDNYAREQYERALRKWANDFSTWLIYSMPQYFNYHPEIAADLYELRKDLYNPNLRARVQRCLANKVANDVENVRNFMNRGDDDRLIGYHVMAINNCYRQVRW